MDQCIKSDQLIRVSKPNSPCTLAPSLPTTLSTRHSSHRSPGVCHRCPPLPSSTTESTRRKRKNRRQRRSSIPWRCSTDFGDRRSEEEGQEAAARLRPPATRHWFRAPTRQMVKRHWHPGNSSAWTPRRRLTGALKTMSMWPLQLV